MLCYNILRLTSPGEVAEGSKAHAWRACGGHKPPVGSNPTLSARVLVVFGILLKPGQRSRFFDYLIEKKRMEVIKVSLSPKEIEKKISELVKPIIERNGLELFDVKYKLQSGKWILTIIIDKRDDYVSTRDCELVSYEIEKVLDKEDLIPGRYFLEVASPGLDRPLRTIEDFKRFQGNYAKVKTNKTIRGYIKDVNLETGEIILEVDEKEEIVNFSDIKSANLEVDMF